MGVSVCFSLFAETKDDRSNLSLGRFKSASKLKSKGISAAIFTGGVYGEKAKH